MESNPNRTWFYYLRDLIGRPYATVCIKRIAERSYVRGVSICSERDVFCRKRGKVIANGRAIKAFFQKKHTLPMARPCNLVFCTSCSFPAAFKSCYLPLLTVFEQRLTGHGGRLT